MPLPVTVAEAKARLGIRNAERDAEIESLIAAAVGQVEDYSGHLLHRRSHVQYGTAFEAGQPVTLHVSPVHSISKVEHLDSGGIATEIAGCRLLGFASQRRIFPAADTAWPLGGHGYAITVDAGYNAAADVPAQLIEAVLLLVGHWFENHEAVVIGSSAVELPLGVKDLCSQFRQPGVT